MDIIISAEGHHQPAGHHFMVVDGHGMLVDLRNVQGTLHDPTIKRVAWGRAGPGGSAAERGVIMRDSSPPQLFFDKSLLRPYLDAFEARKAQVRAGMQESLAKSDG